MGIVNAKDILLNAAAEGYALGAFNVTSIMQMKAVLETADALNSPVIVQTSHSVAQRIGPEVFSAAFGALCEGINIPAVLHLDHCSDVGFCKRCLDAGYTNIMIDGSKLPFEENARVTREVVVYARENGTATVEGELGKVAGVEDHLYVSEDESALCDPLQGLEFTVKTGIDLLAPAIGTAHGVYKSKNPKVDVDRMKTIREKLEGDGINVPLVIHGGTGLPDDLVARLIDAGGAKYNVSTELKYAWIDGGREFLDEQPGVYNPMKLLEVQMRRTSEVVSRWIKVLGSEGRGTAA